VSETRCDCLIPFLEGAGQHAPDCAVFREARPQPHRCHHPTCDVPVPPRLLACRRHWFQLPKRLRDRIWATYRPGQEIDKRSSDEYSEAFDACIAFWRAREGAHP
jgi:hypothetical protein